MSKKEQVEMEEVEEILEADIIETEVEEEERSPEEIQKSLIDLVAMQRHIACVELLKKLFHYNPKQKAWVAKNTTVSAKKLQASLMDIMNNHGLIIETEEQETLEDIMEAEDKSKDNSDG